MGVQREPGQKGVNWSNIAVGTFNLSSDASLMGLLLTPRPHIGGIMNMVITFYATQVTFAECCTRFCSAVCERRLECSLVFSLLKDSNLQEVTTLGQPLEVLKTQMAANRSQTMFQAVQAVWARGGVAGFYQGLIPWVSDRAFSPHVISLPPLTNDIIRLDHHRPGLRLQPRARSSCSPPLKLSRPLPPWGLTPLLPVYLVVWAAVSSRLMLPWVSTFGSQ